MNDPKSQKRDISKFCVFQIVVISRMPDNKQKIAKAYFTLFL